MSTTLRRGTLQLHRWTGLTLGLLLLFLALTGMSLLFRAELEPLAEPALHHAQACASPLSLDRLRAVAQAAHPQVALDRIEIGAQGRPVNVRFIDKIGVYLDPCSGAMLGQQHRWGGLFNTFEQLHRFRFIDSSELGNFFTGSTAMAAVFVFALGGLVIWWPATGKALRRSLKPNLKLKGRAFDLSLHRTVGAYASLVLLIVALTALPIAFKWARAALYVATGSVEAPPRPGPRAVVPGSQRIGVDAAWQRARMLVPGVEEASLIYPRKPGDPYEIQLLGPDAPNPEAVSMVYLDAYSAAVLRFEPYAQSSAGNKIYRFANALHKGEVGGLPVQMLLFLGILGVPVLGYTGASSYLRKRLAAQPLAGAQMLKVDRVRVEAAGIRSFELAALDGRRLPPYEPGAHITVHLASGLARQYSLCGDPAQRDRYVIAVKRCADSRGGSRGMHDEVVEGQVLQISGPRNNFRLEAAASHSVLIAAGIGITPILAMARHLLSIGASFELHYVGRSREEMAFHSLLGGPAFAKHVRLHAGVARQCLPELLASVLASPARGAHLYICGPRPFMVEVGVQATRADWLARNIHIEFFRGDPAAAAADPGHAFDIKLARSGGCLTVPPGKSILQVLGEAGVATASSCREGVCGSCQTEVLAGTPEHRDCFLDEAERRSGKTIMLCVSRAKTSELVLDL